MAYGKRIAQGVRFIDGKIYTRFSTKMTKREAEAVAKESRARGRPARIILAEYHMTGPAGRTVRPWDIYRRTILCKGDIRGIQDKYLGV